MSKGKISQEEVLGSSFLEKKRHRTENCDGIHPTWIVQKIKLNVAGFIINPWILYLKEEWLLCYAMTIMVVNL